MIVKKSTFKRTVKFTRPGETIDSMVPDSYVADFVVVPPQELADMRAVAGGLKDAVLLKRTLVVASDVRNEDGGALTGADAIAAVLADPIATGAGVLEYFKAIGDGIAAKNSAT